MLNQYSYKPGKEHCRSRANARRSRLGWDACQY